MAKKKVTEQSNQLNLTVVALVALVAIVGLVALVLQSANLANVPTGMQQASAENTAGDAFFEPDWGGLAGSGESTTCSCNTDPICQNCGNLIKTSRCQNKCGF